MAQGEVAGPGEVQQWQHRMDAREMPQFPRQCSIYRHTVKFSPKAKLCAYPPVDSTVSPLMENQGLHFGQYLLRPPL